MKIKKEDCVKIGTVNINGLAVLAPMAGVTDYAFRKICAEHDASFLYSEMVSAKALLFNDEKTKKLLRNDEEKKPLAVQIFGSDPEIMAKGAEIALEVSKASVVDINMGCPAPKIFKNGEGCALMLDLNKSSKIISEVSKRVKVPVTVKFRKGVDSRRINAVEFARMAEGSGAMALSLHGRTVEQMFSGKADWDIIKQIKESVKIPVMANGDVSDHQSAVKIMDYTGADLVMIGRAALGDPWIFDRAQAALENREIPSLPNLEERLSTAVRQIELAVKDKGEHIAMLEARKHLIWYLKGVNGTKQFKIRISKLSCLTEMYDLVSEITETLN